MSDHPGNIKEIHTPKSFLGYKNVTERVSNAIRHKSKSVVELNYKKDSVVRVVKNTSDEHKKLKKIQNNLRAN
jgi:hypothetical protein